jgi:TrmH family RNA methyltransferase
MAELISSHSNPLVKQVRALRQKKGRAESGLFLVEGIHHVREALKSGWQVEALLAAPELLTSDYARQLLEDADRVGIRTVHLPASLFETLAEKENPQGLLAVTRQRFSSLADLSPQDLTWGAACVSPQDPGNVGAILRTLDAVGADGLFLLDGSVDPFHPSAVRASMGAIFWKPLIQASFESFVSWCKSHQYLLVGASARVSLDYREFRRGGKRAILLLGSEQKGLSAEQLAACDVTLSLPMRGRTSSLNLAVAAGVLLYALDRD